MTSKTILTGLLLLAVLGCNKDTDIATQTKDAPSSVIRFGGGKIAKIVQSKAMIEESILPDQAKIGIFAWGHHKNDGDNNTTLRSDLANSLYIKAADSNELIANVEAHYPIHPDTLLNIYAYYPYQTAETNHSQKLAFDLSNQEDLMWATPVLNRNKTTSDDMIELTFNHILSAITLIFKKADDIQEEMVLQSISLEAYNPVVELDIQEGKLTQTPTQAPFDLITNLNIPITSEQQTVVTNRMLCPVDKPVFIIHMSDHDYRVESTKAFMPGKKQTYEFTLQAKDILISGSINPWEDGGTSNETIFF